jgi:hypothetical protein
MIPQHEKTGHSAIGKGLRPLSPVGGQQTSAVAEAEDFLAR